VFALVMGVGAAQAETVVKIAPPKVRVEQRGPRPSPDHVWVSGYQRWDGKAYAWQPGRWEAPPRRHAKWVAPKWRHRHDGWVLEEGHWR